VGHVVLGRVQKVMPGIEAAFVDIGLERTGFLGLREAKIRPHRDRARLDGCETYPDARISDYVREGEAVLVQIIKDPIGDKGARLSRNITLPGRALVLVPLSGGVALSRRIDDAPERARAVELVERFRHDETLVPGAGYIVRTAAIGASEAELREEAARLAASWRTIVAACADSAMRPPRVLYSDFGPVERILRDEVGSDVRRIVIDDPAAARAARAYCAQAAPALVEKIAVHDGLDPVFESFGVADEIAGLAHPRVPLPSGAWLTIEQTEALTAIDVNSGSFAGSGGLEEASLAVNLEAAHAIGRQLSLRDIGGLIVIDFIHLASPENTARVLEALTQSVSRSRVPSQILGMSAFGLVEMTRKRVRESLHRRHTDICRCCDGAGRQATAETVGLEVLRRLEASAKRAPGRTLHVRAAPDVARWLQGHVEQVRADLSRRGVGEVRFTADETRTRQGFAVETLP
jgi:ribonuclease G